MEGYDVECVDDVSKDFYCVICHKLIRKAIQIKCGHGMCNGCYQHMKSSNEEKGYEVVCPTCRNPVQENEVVSVPMLDRIISSLNIKCPNNEHGCLWVGNLETLSHHFQKCQFALKRCSQCSEMICGFKLDEHRQSECSNAEVDCPYEFIGCEIKILHRDLDEHLVNSSPAHIDAMMEMLTEKDKTISALREENESLKTEIIHTKEQLKEFLVLKDSISKITKVFDEIMSKCTDGDQKLDSKSDNVGSSSNEMNHLHCHANEKHPPKDIKDKALENLDRVLVEVDDEEFMERLKETAFIYAHFNLSHPQFVTPIIDSAKAEYSRLSKCLEDQVLTRIDSVGNSVKTGVKFSLSYWDAYSVSLKEWFKEAVSKKSQIIDMYCKQLLYLQDHEVNDLIPEPWSKSIKVGDYYCVRVQYRETGSIMEEFLGRNVESGFHKPTRKAKRSEYPFESPCKDSCYYLQDSLLTFRLPNTKEAYLYNLKTFERVSGRQIQQYCYQFNMNNDNMYNGNMNNNMFLRLLLE